ncbi:MAG: hypothetical protein LBG89_00260 [Rickettsiales bacterium]|nr:hypothetical protein [Rickettsiales bacterium]
MKTKLLIGTLALLTFVSGAEAATITGNKAKAVQTTAAKKATTGATASRAVMTPGILKKTATPTAGITRAPGFGGAGSTSTDNNSGANAGTNTPTGSGSQYALQSDLNWYVEDTRNEFKNVYKELDTLEDFKGLSVKQNIGANADHNQIPTSLAVKDYVSDMIGGADIAQVIADNVRNVHSTDKVVPKTDPDGAKMVQSGAVHEYISKSLGDIHSALMLINGTAN